MSSDNIGIESQRFAYALRMQGLAMRGDMSHRGLQSMAQGMQRPPRQQGQWMGMPGPVMMSDPNGQSMAIREHAAAIDMQAKQMSLAEVSQRLQVLQNMSATEQANANMQILKANARRAKLQADLEEKRYSDQMNGSDLLERLQAHELDPLAIKAIAGLEVGPDGAPRRLGDEDRAKATSEYEHRESRRDIARTMQSVAAKMMGDGYDRTAMAAGVRLSTASIAVRDGRMSPEDATKLMEQIVQQPAPAESQDGALSLKPSSASAKTTTPPTVNTDDPYAGIVIRRPGADFYKPESKSFDQLDDERKSIVRSIMAPALKRIDDEFGKMEDTAHNQKARILARKRLMDMFASDQQAQDIFFGK